MKAASVVLKNDEYKELKSYGKLVGKLEEWLEACSASGVSVVVFPALLGCFFDDWEGYINDVAVISRRYKGMAICPGSCHERSSGKTWHTSCLILEGQVVLRQRQIYLAKWEKELGLSRGEELGSFFFGGMKLGLLVSTDIFYPQVSRALALSGVELVLAPAAVRGGREGIGQFAGLWQNVQSNLFFGVESGFKGCFRGKEFFSASMLHGPLEMTEKGDGILGTEASGEWPIVAADTDNVKRKAAVKRFDTLAQLNTDAYMDMFGGHPERRSP